MKIIIPNDDINEPFVRKAASRLKQSGHWDLLENVVREAIPEQREYAEAVLYMALYDFINARRINKELEGMEPGDIAQGIDNRLKSAVEKIKPQMKMGRTIIIPPPQRRGEMGRS